MSYLATGQRILISLKNIIIFFISQLTSSVDQRFMFTFLKNICERRQERTADNGDVKVVEGLGPQTNVLNWALDY